MNRDYASGFALALLGLSSAFSSCANIPVASALRLSRIDPVAIDFSEVEAALRMQDVYRVTPGSVTFSIAYERQGEAPLRREESFVLEERDAAASRLLNERRKSGFIIQRFALAPRDGERLNGLRDFIEASRANGENSLSLDVAFGLCATDPEAERPAALTTVFVKTSVEQDFITLIKEGSYRDGLEDAETSLKPCDEA